MFHWSQPSVGMDMSRWGTPIKTLSKMFFLPNHKNCSCILRHVGSDPQAERGTGEVNISPTVGLTLRPRVGGFYVSGRLWDAQSIVFYAYPSSESASKMRPLRQKLRQNCDPLGRNRAESISGGKNATPAGCGDADLLVNRGHEHLDLHVFQGSQDVPRWWER